MIEVLAVPTCRRPKLLQRCLRSLLDNCSRHGRSPEILVADDSISTSWETQNREVLRSLKASYPGFRFEYVGSTAKRRYTRLLAKSSGVDASTVSFALQNTGDLVQACGLNRNAILLKTAGLRIMTVDDDVVCRPSAIHHGETAIQHRGDPTDIIFWSSSDVLLRNHPICDYDLLGENAAALAGLHRNTHSPSSTFTGLCPSSRTLAAVRDISAVWNSFYGDSGSRTPLSYLWKDAHTCRQLHRLGFDYTATLRSRLISRGTSERITGPYHFLQSLIISLDNRTCLPPFIATRGLDLTFGRMLKALRPDLRITYLPTGLLHAPPERDLADANFAIRALNTPLSICLDVLVKRWAASGPHGSTSALLLQNLGTYLIEVAKLPRQEAESLLVRLLRYRLEKRISHLKRLKAEYVEGESPWLYDLERHILHLEHSRKRSVLRQSILRTDLARATADPTETMLTYLRRFAELLFVWPTLYSTAASLRQEAY